YASTLTTTQRGQFIAASTTNASRVDKNEAPSASGTSRQAFAERRRGRHDANKERRWRCVPRRNTWQLVVAAGFAYAHRTVPACKSSAVDEYYSVWRLFLLSCRAVYVASSDESTGDAIDLNMLRSPAII
ncbi:hypothetical protein SPRG_06385, partial [Saprolegnia parasitica CBS 223.65]